MCVRLANLASFAKLTISTRHFPPRALPSSIDKLFFRPSTFFLVPSPEGSHEPTRTRDMASLSAISTLPSSWLPCNYYRSDRYNLGAATYLGHGQIPRKALDTVPIYHNRHTHTPGSLRTYRRVPRCNQFAKLPPLGSLRRAPRFFQP
jgi:hypothetical protein